MLTVIALQDVIGVPPIQHCCGQCGGLLRQVSIDEQQHLQEKRPEQVLYLFWREPGQVLKHESGLSSLCRGQSIPDLIECRWLQLKDQWLLDPCLGEQCVVKQLSDERIRCHVEIPPRGDYHARVHVQQR